MNLSVNSKHHLKRNSKINDPFFRILSQSSSKDNIHSKCYYNYCTRDTTNDSKIPKIQLNGFFLPCKLIDHCFQSSKQVLGLFEIPKIVESFQLTDESGSSSLHISKFHCDKKVYWNDIPLTKKDISPASILNLKSFCQNCDLSKHNRNLFY